MNDYSTTKKVTITFSDTLQIYKFLQQETVLKLLDPVAKTYQYQGNWNDRTVAEHFTMVLQKKVSQNNVSGLRCREFGQLAPSHFGPVNNGEMLQRIYDLTTEVRALQKRVDKLEREHGLINHNG